MFINVFYRSASFIECVYVDPIHGIVEIAYLKGSIWRYTNVSKRAILNLLINPVISLGRWHHRNLIMYGCKRDLYGTKCKLHPLDAAMHQSSSVIL